MPLIDVDYLKPLVGVSVSDTSQDAVLQAYVDGADAAVRRYCNRNFESADYTEYLTGNNTPRLALRQTPVTALAGVWLNNSGYFGRKPDTPFDSTTLLTEGQDYVLDRDDAGGESSRTGILFRIGTVWPMLNRVVTMQRLGVDMGPSYGNVKVTYTAGFLVIPADLKVATAMVAVQMKRLLPLGGSVLKSERLGDYAYELGQKVLALPELGTLRTALACYKEIGW